jgi:succinate dehydrogenase hydrophobic anchor subunit
MERTLRRNNASLGWLAQSISGLLLVGLLGLHLIANHFIVPGGLQTYRDVVHYLSNPLILALETVFLAVVTLHALLGVRALLLDAGLPAHAEGRVNVSLAALGLVIVVYALWLTFTIVNG